MHYSRVSVPANKVYSAASAVLVNEILKGGISFGIAYARLNPANGNDGYERILDGSPSLPSYPSHSLRPQSKLQILFKQVASPDSWKLSIPALLYVLQNNLQYIAVSNLDVPTFQVTNQMKILTTAAFSVLLLKKRLSGWKWASLALLAVGVGIVQIQASTGVDPSHTLRSEVTERSSVQIGDSLGTGQDTVNLLPAELHPIRGFLAVTAACFTSGLAGVYFEMVLKGSSADLWVRNVQLSLWSLIPAFFPVIVGLLRDGQGIRDMFQNFGGWAWVTVITQVSGGLITALVIKVSYHSQVYAPVLIF
jgi:UDP-sugar transporter A1/2/3